MIASECLLDLPYLVITFVAKQEYHTKRITIVWSVAKEISIHVCGNNVITVQKKGRLEVFQDGEASFKLRKVDGVGLVFPSNNFLWGCLKSSAAAKAQPLFHRCSVRVKKVGGSCGGGNCGRASSLDSSLAAAGRGGNQWPPVLQSREAAGKTI